MYPDHWEDPKKQNPQRVPYTTIGSFLGILKGLEALRFASMFKLLCISVGDLDSARVRGVVHQPATEEQEVVCNRDGGFNALYAVLATSPAP